MRLLSRSALLCLLGALAPSCVDGLGVKDDTADGEEADADADSDADTDADSDADSDADVDCEDPPPVPEIGADCIAATLGCNETIVSTTEGGTTGIDGANYSSFWACEVTGTEVYRGPERMIEFQHPGDGDVTLSLDSPCEDLDIFAMFYEGNTCITGDSLINECEADIGRGGGSVTIWNNSPRRYVIVVEGEFGEEAPFALTSFCP